MNERVSSAHCSANIAFDSETSEFYGIVKRNGAADQSCYEDRGQAYDLRSGA